MRAWRYGDPRQPRAITWKDVAPILPIAQEWLRRNPPPSDVLARLFEHVLSPAATYAFSVNPDPVWLRGKRLSDARLKLGDEMAWWRSPESAFNSHTYGQPQQRGSKRTRNAVTDAPTPEYVLRVLLATEVFVTERQWGVGRVPELSRAVMVIRCRRLRGRKRWNKKKQREEQRVHHVSHLARKLLAQVISESVGVYLLSTAPKVIEHTHELRQAVAARINQKGTWGGPRKTKAQLESAAAIKRKLLTQPTELVANTTQVADDVFSRWLRERYPSNDTR